MHQLVHRQLRADSRAKYVRSKIHGTVLNKSCKSHSRVARRHVDRVMPVAAADQSSADTPKAKPARSDDESLFWQVVIPTALVLLVCNVDRICMSVAVIPMSSTFGWSPSVQGFIGSAFLWGYMATQLLGGQAADKYGGKLVISAAIVFFSLATLLPLATPLVPAAHVLTLIAVSRFLGEFLSSAAAPKPHEALVCKRTTTFDCGV